MKLMKLINSEVKIKELEKELNDVKSTNYKYERLFSKMFGRSSLINVKRLSVEKIIDGKATFRYELEDGTYYVYEINLVKMGYEGEFNEKN